MDLLRRLGYPARANDTELQRMEEGSGIPTIVPASNPVPLNAHLSASLIQTDNSKMDIDASTAQEMQQQLLPSAKIYSRRGETAEESPGQKVRIIEKANPGPLRVCTLKWPDIT